MPARSPMGGPRELTQHQLSPVLCRDVKTHNDADGARVNAPLALGRRHPLDAVHARFPPQDPKRSLARDFENRFPERIARAHSDAGNADALDEARLPPLAHGEPGVHAHELGREQGRL